MATLTLGKSVTIDAVQSKKGDAVFVERRRRVVAPGTRELREEPSAPAPARNAADEKLRAVLEAARAREAVEAAAAAARAAEIERETREYEQVKEQLAARESAAADAAEEKAAPEKPKAAAPQKTFTQAAPRGPRAGDEEEGASRGPGRNNHNKKDFKKGGKISLHDIVIGGGDDDDEIALRGANRRRSEASLKRFREKARAMFTAPQKVALFWAIQLRSKTWPRQWRKRSETLLKS